MKLRKLNLNEFFYDLKIKKFDFCYSSIHLISHDVKLQYYSQSLKNYLSVWIACCKVSLNILVMYYFICFSFFLINKTQYFAKFKNEN